MVSEAWTGEQGRGVPTVSHSLFSRTSTLSGVLRPAICSGCPIVRGRPPQIPIQQEGRPTAPPQGSVEVARRSLALRPAHSRRHQKNALHVSAGLKEATCIASRRRCHWQIVTVCATAKRRHYAQRAELRDCSWVIDLDWTQIVPRPLPHLRPTADTSLRANSKLTRKLARSSPSPGRSAPSWALLIALIIGSNPSIMIRRLRSARASDVSATEKAPSRL